MVGWIVFLAILYYAGVPAVVATGVATFAWPLEAMVWASPIAAIVAVGRGVELQPVWKHVGITAAVGTLLWPLVLLFGRSRLDDTAEDTGVRGGGRLAISAMGRESLKKLAAARNPTAVMRWRDHQFKFGGFRHELILGLIVMGALAAVTLGAMAFLGSSAKEMAYALLFILSGTGGLFYVILGISRGSSAFDSERRSGQHGSRHGAAHSALRRH